MHRQYFFTTMALLMVNTKISNYGLKIIPSLRASRNCKSARVSSLSLCLSLSLSLKILKLITAITLDYHQTLANVRQKIELCPAKAAS